MGGWKPNSIVYVTNNGCSKLKSIAGKAWNRVLKSVNSTTECPIPIVIFNIYYFICNKVFI